MDDLDIDVSGEDDSSSGRGAKGSLRDRIISIIYHKRYEKFRLQREFYNKDNLNNKIKYIRTIKDFELENVSKLDSQDKGVINNLKFVIPVIPITKKYDEFSVPVANDSSEDINELHSISEKIANSKPTYNINNRTIYVDPDTEVFDFDKYDYYEIEQIKNGIDIKDIEQDEYDIVNIEKEEQLAMDEKVIVEELNTFIEDNLLVLDEIKGEIAVIKDEVSKPYTLEQAEDLERRYQKLKEKVDKLKAQFDTVKTKYDFSDFAILDSIKIMDSIEDYHDNAKLDSIEIMVDVCKNEINKIDGIIIASDNTIKVGYDIEDKKEEIVDRTIAFEKNREKTNKVETMEDRVAIELIEQRRILDDIKSRVDKIEVIDIPNITISGYGKMFASFLKIAAGILTTPISNRRIFGIAMGTSLINKGLRGLRQGLTVETNTETILKYEDLEREIINCKDKIGLTNVLLIDSIEQVNKLREEFKDRFEAYIYLIPEYNESLKKLDSLQKKLEQKQLEIKLINKDLDLQYEKNKLKMKKVNK